MAVQGRVRGLIDAADGLDVFWGGWAAAVEVVALGPVSFLRLSG